MDWKKIKAEYIAGGTSYRKLAEKYNVPFGTLRRVAKKEGWTQKRSQIEHKVDKRLEETVIDNKTQMTVDIIDVADRLLAKITEVLELAKTTQDIRHLTSALKDLRDIKGIKSDIDLKEQEARIAKLQKDAQAEATDTDIKVVIEGDLDAYSN